MSEDEQVGSILTSTPESVAQMPSMVHQLESTGMNVHDLSVPLWAIVMVFATPGEPLTAFDVMYL